MGGDDQRRHRDVGGDQRSAAEPAVIAMYSRRQTTPMRDHRRGEDEPAGDGDRDREGDPGQRDERSACAVSPPAAPAPVRRARRPRGRFSAAALVARTISSSKQFAAPRLRPRPEAPLPRLELAPGMPRRPRGRSPARARRERPAPSRRTARAGSWRSAARRWCGSGGLGRASRARRGVARNSSSELTLEASRRIDDLRPAAVVEGDEEGDPLVAGGRSARPSPSRSTRSGSTPSRRPTKRIRTPSSFSSGVSASIRSPNIRISPSTSSAGRDQFSVEKEKTVSSSIPSSTASRSRALTTSAPAWCPSTTGSPRCCAQRPLPSVMIAT